MDALSYNVSFIPKIGYLHVTVTGINNKINVASYLNDILQECTDKKYERVLIEERLDGPRLNLLDIFKIISEAGSRYKGNLKSVVYVDLNAESDSMQFAETVAINRSLPVRVFSNLAEAEKWLLERINKG